MITKLNLILLFFFLVCQGLFSQNAEVSDTPIELFYFYDFELAKIEKEITVLESAYKEEPSLVLLSTLTKKKLKKEVLNVYGSKAIKHCNINLENFAYFSATEKFLSKQKELEEKYDIKINLNADQETLEEVKGLGTKVLKTFTKNESSSNNRRIDVSFHSYSSLFSVGYKISLSGAIATELSNKPSFEEHTYDLNSSNELVTTKFITDLEAYLSGLTVRIDSKNISELWELRNAPDSTITFMSPAGKPFTLLLRKLSKVGFSYNDEDIQTPGKYDFFADGSLQSFTYNNLNYVRCRLEKHREHFDGYYVEGSNCGNALPDTLSKKITQANKVVVVYACVVDGKLVFKANKVPVSSSVAWPSTNHNASGAFLETLPVQFSAISGDPVILSAAALTSTYSTDSKRFLEALNICDRDYIPYAITVANIITLCPKLISQCYGLDRLIDDFDLTKHLLSTSNNSLPQTRTPLEQYQDKVVILMQRVKELQSYANNTLNTDNQTKSFTNPATVIEYVNDASNICALNFISNTERIRLIKVLLPGMTIGGQSALVTLFKTINLEISDANTVAFFDALIHPSNNCSNGNCLISEICSKLTFGDYKELNKILCSKLTAKAGVIDAAFPKTDSELFNATLYFDDSDYGPAPPIGTHKYAIELMSNGNVKINKEYVSEHIMTTVKIEGGFDTKLKALWTSATATLNPFTIITLRNRSSLASLADIDNEGNIITGPAIFLKFANDKKFNEDALQAAALVTDVLTVASGPGLIVKAYRAGKITLAIYEGTQVVGSIANIAVNSLSANDPLRKWLDQFNLLVVGWGIGRGTGKLLTADYSSLAKLANFNGLDKTTLQNLTKQYELLRTQIASYINNPALTQQIDNVIEYLRGMVKGSKLVKDLTWIDELVVILPNGAKDKLINWINEGVDNKLLKAAFNNNSNKSKLFSDLDVALSKYHRGIIINDFTNLPGLTKTIRIENCYPQGHILRNTKIKLGNGTYDPDFDVNYSGDVMSFVNGTAELIELSPGTKLYRVCNNGVDQFTGGYWTRSKPTSLGEVIGGTAVQPEWNSFNNIVEFTVPTGGISVWKGNAASQKVSNSLNIGNPHLAGGSEQILIPLKYRRVKKSDGTFDFRTVKQEFSENIVSLPNNQIPWK